MNRKTAPLPDHLHFVSCLSTEEVVNYLIWIQHPPVAEMRQRINNYSMTRVWIAVDIITIIIIVIKKLFFFTHTFFWDCLSSFLVCLTGELPNKSPSSSSSSLPPKRSTFFADNAFFFTVSTKEKLSQSTKSSELTKAKSAHYSKPKL